MGTGVGNPHTLNCAIIAVALNDDSNGEELENEEN